MFGLGFFSRKLATPASSSGTTIPVSLSEDTPSPQAEPPITPSPPPQDLITDPNPLHALITSVPAQTLHAYTLAHIIPPSQPLSPLSFPHIPLPSDPPSPRTLTALTNFFASLVPPPRMHCVRCHKGYFEVENTDRSCLVPHDDESAEVERVGAIGRSKGIGTEYETLWGCCGRTVEGDGDMGPPDGWCYEGKHTTDIKRARFRADSTPQDDKLTSCERLRCHEPPSSSRSTRSRANKRRRALMEEADNEDAQSSADGSTVSGTSSNNGDDSASARKPKRARRSKSNSVSSNVDAAKAGKGDNDVAMETPGTKTTTKAKSPLASSFTPPSPPAENTALSQIDKEKAPSTLPRTVVEITTERDGSPRLANPVSRKSSNISLREPCKGDDIAQTDKEKPKPKSRARKSAAVDVATPTPKSSRSKKAAAGDSTTESTSTATRSKSLKPKSSSGALKPKSSIASLKAATNVKPVSSTSAPSSAQKPQSKAGSVGKRRGKTLTEVVGTSVEGEGNL
ncbi:hypothetical protein P691DRAFT_807336 [Macrolepiota fuliginosa MF-IS2]|uniref:Uncharacterized protein n=1 Tax=Macrolepiota fuliginosa MF-IS2 TaxID=1400762 RepID=A0A9P6C0C1_9AGAR|nr:hypothetical protein P691DRAFT_807336 [Macrolepiota fuliginosa MF-IS2]